MRTLAFEQPSALVAACVLEQGSVGTDQVHVMGVDRPAVWLPLPIKASPSPYGLANAFGKQRSTTARWAAGGIRGVPPRGRPV